MKAYSIKTGYKTSFAVLALAVFFSCSAEGPLSPADAFDMLKRSLIAGDADAVAGLLSADSLRKIRDTAAVFEAMSPEATKNIAAYYSLSPANLARLSAADHVRVILVRGSGSKLHLIRDAHPIDVETEKGTSAILLSNGVRILFVKEGPYWKFVL